MWIIIGDLKFSDTYAAFAADLLSDCRSILQKMTARLDDDEAFRQKRLQIRDDARHHHPALGYADRDTLWAAAVYAQWISDQIRREIAAQTMRDLTAATKLVDTETDRQLMQLRYNEVASHNEAADEMPCPPPPAPLNYAAEHAGRVRLNLVSEMLSDAICALSRLQTDAVHALHTHIAALHRWAAGQ